jgi:uncharacterized protein YoaH (UPF0181 family)
MAKNTKRIVNVMSKGVSAGDAIGITRIQDLMRAEKKAQRSKEKKQEWETWKAPAKKKDVLFPKDDSKSVKVKDFYGEKHTVKEKRGNSYMVGGGNTTFVHKSKVTKESSGRRDDYCRDDEGKFSSC